VSYRRHVYSVD